MQWFPKTADSLTVTRRTAIIPICSVIVVWLLWALLVPNFVHEPNTSPQNACINNLRLIDGAKQAWALANNKTNGPVTWNDISPYLSRVSKGGTLRCPSGGTYTLGNVEEAPKCSIAGHALV